MRRNGIPKSLLISGLTWPVRLRAKILYRKQPCDGLCRPKEQDILMLRDYAARHDRARKTLLHEGLHALLFDRQDLYENESLINLLEERLDEFIRLNPEFFALYGYHITKGSKST